MTFSAGLRADLEFRPGPWHPQGWRSCEIEDVAQEETSDGGGKERRAESVGNRGSAGHASEMGRDHGHGNWECC